MLILQIVLGGLIQPVLYIPASGATVNGLLIKILSPSKQYYLGFFLIGCVVASTVALFEYRFQAILPKNSALKLSKRTRIIIFVVRITVASNNSLPIQLYIDSDNDAGEHWKEELSCLPGEALADKATFFIEPEHFKFVFIFLIIAGFQCLIEAILYVVGSLRKLNPFVKHECSDRTKQLQWSFLKALLIQECAPILIAYPLPACYLLFSCYTKYMNMGGYFLLRC
ncbi:unnamed protein product [Caenorhabditis auriculariae]|uniref:Uncharacterized protein n=1 Tax=Caenorhabditis auriculariae TaxID=2777116 RepID=A0A8S1HYL7_9PELO|nr:unnamed protein product [Caenorhabditis auriculariae]